MAFNLVELSNPFLLKKSWLSVRRGKTEKIATRSKGIDGVSLFDFGQNLPENLSILSEELRLGKYHAQPVKVVLEKKNNGKFRIISVPTIRDRIVQRAMLELFKPCLTPVISTGVSYCGAKNDEDESISLKNAIEKVVYHVGQGCFWIFESDIVSFFDRIPKQALLDKLRDTVPMDIGLTNLLVEYIYFEVGNPEKFVGKEDISIPVGDVGITQGSALSPIFANLYLAEFDIALKSLFGDRLIRYVDDFIIMCKTKDEAIIAYKFALQELAKVGLDLSPENKKTFIKNLKASEVINFLGISIQRRGLFPEGGKGAALTHMNDVLNRSSYKKSLIRGTKILDIAYQMEEKIVAWGNHYRFYHVDQLYKDLDEHIESTTRKMSDVRTLKPLRNIFLFPIISREKWHSFFLR
ncbi:MAG: reverse transcriptase domain-containing protein [Candidatus Gracilibacteria bacterium]